MASAVNRGVAVSGGGECLGGQGPDPIAERAAQGNSRGGVAEGEMGTALAVDD